MFIVHLDIQELLKTVQSINLELTNHIRLI